MEKLSKIMIQLVMEPRKAADLCRFILIFHKKFEKLFVKVVPEFKSSNSHF